MASSPKAQEGSTSFSDSIKLEKLDAHTFRANLNEAFCIGAVPNGGYTASCMLAAAGVHLSSRDQPDTLTAHFEYPNRAAVGPAIVVIDDVKLTGQLSTLHLTLWQGDLPSQAPWIDRSKSRRIVIAYTTHTNLRTFSGITLPTGWQTTPAAELPPLPDFGALGSKIADETWEESKLPGSAARLMRSLSNWRFYLPLSGPLEPGVLDMWIRFASGERITQATLPYVIDSFPYNLHTFLAAPELRRLLEAPPEQQVKEDDREKARETHRQNEQRGGLWFPTVVMNMEAKMALPEEGVEWLAVRITSKQIRDGKFDLEVLVRDQEGEIVALSHHVAMILSIERNMGKKQSRNGDSAKPSL